MSTTTTAPQSLGVHQLLTQQRQNHSLGTPGDPTAAPHSPRAYISALAARFPSLIPLSPNDWDPLEYVQAHELCSPGTYMAALFIAHVWNPGWAKANLPAFDALEALSTWDTTHRQAFTTWANGPYWP